MSTRVWVREKELVTDNKDSPEEGSQDQQKGQMKISSGLRGNHRYLRLQKPASR